MVGNDNRQSGAVVQVTVTFTHFSGNAHHFFSNLGFPLLRQTFLKRDLRVEARASPDAGKLALNNKLTTKTVLSATITRRFASLISFVRVLKGGKNDGEVSGKRKKENSVQESGCVRGVLSRYDF
jgi:hypothetical protein